MLRRLFLFVCAIALSFPPVFAEAASHKSGKHRATAVSKSKNNLSNRRIHTLRSSRNYGASVASYTLQGVQFQQGGKDTELRLESSKALILNQDTGEVLYAKNIGLATPIASVTKLMTAMVVLDAHQPMDESVTVSSADVDNLKGTGSRLRVGTTLTRAEMLQLALMSSENRAASALGHAYPGGYDAFVRAMNAKALALGMTRSVFIDATGLNSENVSTAEDLAKMVKAAYQYPEIRQVTTTATYEVPLYGQNRPAEFRNTNILVRNSDWQIGLSKTGFINEAGRCLVMQAQIAEQPLIIVLLDSWGKYTRIGDAQRVRKWIESSNGVRKLG